MYYFINDIHNPSIDEDEDDYPFLEIHEELLKNPLQGWSSGISLKDPPGKVINIEATPVFGYTGPPPDIYDDAISLISPKLKQVFDDLKIANIDYYPVIISYRESSEKYDWFAFNIRGHIHKKSLSDPSFKMSEKILRLFENPKIIIINESLKKSIKNAKINTFQIENIEDSISIC